MNKYIIPRDKVVWHQDNVTPDGGRITLGAEYGTARVRIEDGVLSAGIARDVDGSLIVTGCTLITPDARIEVDAELEQ